MKNLYTYYPEFDGDDHLQWHVYENATDQIVASFFFEEDAQKLAQFFERGGGFAGFTPSFMLQRKYAIDINDAFAAEFA